MSDRTDQRQQGGDSSTNVQAGAVTINSLSYRDVRDIALDVFSDNFEKLSANAAKTAIGRVEEFTTKFLEKLEASRPEAIQQAEEPAFQMALLTAQKEYARTGEKELGDILVDLLIDRSDYEAGTLQEVVLREALAVVPKLNGDQLTILALIFGHKYLRHPKLGSLKDFCETFEKVARLAKGVAIGSNITHLSFCSCIETPPFQNLNFGDLLRDQYPALFTRGFNPKNPEDHALLTTIPNVTNMLMRSMHDPEFLQFTTEDFNSLTSLLASRGVAPQEITKIDELWKSRRLSMEEVEAWFGRNVSGADQFLTLWGAISHCNLTSVGIALGHAKFVHLFPYEGTSLAGWIK
ncbi:MAG TPA: LPO_1073/Vpar_1526 family protein [Chthoniobacteraceae bacterium]|jgi:hypothetical protein|nr:LPO_1073/Vpar_1526 family protein [Chthoniobacteraceae bacterium]